MICRATVRHSFGCMNSAPEPLTLWLGVANRPSLTSFTGWDLPSSSRRLLGPMYLGSVLSPAAREDSRLGRPVSTPCNNCRTLEPTLVAECVMPMPRAIFGHYITGGAGLGGSHKGEADSTLERSGTAPSLSPRRCSAAFSAHSPGHFCHPQISWTPILFDMCIRFVYSLFS